MKNLLKSMAVAAALGLSLGAQAQAPAGAPAGTTGLCKDGSYYSGASKKGACAGHKGVKDWYGGTAAASTPAAMAPAAAPAPKAAAPAATAAPAAPATATEKKTTAAAPGGGPGQVWANSSTKVYHCPSDRYYGKTKSGAYMSEADAKAKGYKPDHGKACS
ncbi:DUF3761 domain-containing protein [Cupriavidus metallidurans]|uniref:DUF3761 domain-containing protein n=1 Tax=Cupriavidus metallidurans TaxID=119219 RepID=UPI001CCC35A3|nr:DUF3761 domain-containing protein [Cupriavidus metallidurans]UBM09204.1 DUF3761 domain-containing protein [Cupriavidus metallidurans]